MRFILHNPHRINFFGRTVHDWLVGGKVPAKLDYFSTYIKEGKAIIYCDKNGSSLQMNFIRKSKILTGISNLLEIYVWMLVNGMNVFKTKVVFNYKKLQKDDVLFMLTHNYLDADPEYAKRISGIPSIKVFYLTHYMYKTSQVAENVFLNKDFFLLAENNLKKNSKFFNKYFNNYNKDVYCLPFAYKLKYIKTKGFDERLNKCLALGSVQEYDINNPSYKEIYNFSGENTFHPMRKRIYFSKEDLEDVIDSRISHIDEETKAKLSKVKTPHGNSLQRTFAKLKNIYISSYSGYYARRSYYNFDIVELYNSYKMFIVPEEVADLPGIGFVEGMACGCAYIGIENDMYNDLGLVPGKHYIGYDGTMDSLREVIRYYQQNPDQTERIAAEGYKFVTSNFNSKAVAEKFYNDILKIKTHGKNMFKSSFVAKG